MLQQTKKAGSSLNRGPAKNVPASVPELSEVLFYGASRFEQPEIGLVFVRENEKYRILSIAKSDRNYLRRFSQVWEFTALCERLPSRVH